MVQHFKKLGKNILIYGLADTVNKLLAIFLVPLFTHYLTPAQYGVAGILSVTTTLISSLCDMGLTSGMARYYHEENEGNKKKLVSTAQIAMFSLSLILAAVAIIFSAQLSNLLFKSPDFRYIVILNFMTVPLTVAISAPMMRLRLEERAKVYSFINMARVITGLIFNITLIVFLKRGLNGLFEGPFLQALTFALVFLVYSIWTKTVGFSKPMFLKMFAIGFPLIFAGMFFWVINWADRFILARISDLTNTGLYTLGYALGMAIMLPVGAFTTAWVPFYLSISKEKNAKEIYALVMTYYSLIIVFFILILSVFSRDYFYFFTPENYHSAYIIIPVISLAYAIGGAFSIAASASFLAKRTVLDLIAESTAVVLNIGLMFILIPTFGRMGAAWATLVAYISLPVIIIFLTRKIFPIKYDYLRILRVVLIGLLIYFICEKVYQPNLINLLWRFLVILSYPIILFLTGFFQHTEIIKIKAILNKIFRKKDIEEEFNQPIQRD